MEQATISWCLFTVFFRVIVFTLTNVVLRFRKCSTVKMIVWSCWCCTVASWKTSDWFELQAEHWQWWHTIESSATKSQRSVGLLFASRSVLSCCWLVSRKGIKHVKMCGNGAVLASVPQREWWTDGNERQDKYCQFSSRSSESWNSSELPAHTYGP